MIIKDIREVVGDWSCNAALIATAFCDWKCELEGTLTKCACQNSHLARLPNYDLTYADIIDIYSKYDTVSALIFAGLEPLLQLTDVLGLIEVFREDFSDPVIIYTGYNKDEIFEALESLSEYSDIYMKFGRYIAGHKPHRDPLVGVELASDNQYFEKLS